MSDKFTEEQMRALILASDKLASARAHLLTEIFSPDRKMERIKWHLQEAQKLLLAALRDSRAMAEKPRDASQKSKEDCA
jgi:hypothetical protein